MDILVKKSRDLDGISEHVLWYFPTGVHPGQNEISKGIFQGVFSELITEIL